jgi:anti-anti-sigma factor
VLEDLYPGGRAAGQAVVALPEHIGASNAGQVREELLSAINRGATTLIADMTMTISCDHAGADAVVRAWQRAAASGTELRLVVTAKTVSQVLGLRGLDRLVSVYPSLEAATAARLPATVTVLAAARPRRPAAFAAAVPDGTGTAPLAAELLEALQDAVALADGDGTIVAASGRMEEMFGYGRGELPGHLIESLVPDGLQEAHRGHWAAWARAPRTRPMAAGLRLAGLRKDGTTFPVQVSLAPVTTAAGQFTFAVIRDAAEARQAEDLAVLARDAATERQEHLRLLDAVITGLFHAGLTLQASLELPADAARARAEAVLDVLDDIIRQVRGTAFAVASGQPPPPAPSRDDR